MDVSDLFHSFIPIEHGAVAKNSFERDEFDVEALDLLVRLVHSLEFLKRNAPLYSNFTRFGESLSSKERDALDAEMRSVLAASEARLEALASAARPARSSQAKEHRSGVVMCVLEVSQRISELNTQLTALRTERKRGAASKADFDRLRDLRAKRAFTSSKPEEDAVLPKAQRTELQAESRALYDHLKEEAKDVASLETNMTEVSTLLGAFTERIAEQHEQIEALFDDAIDNVDLVERVPEELRKARESGSAARRFVVGFLLSASVLLLLLDSLD